MTDYYDITQWLCPSEPLPLYGIKSEANHTVINIKMDYCLFQSWCASLADIVSYIQNEKRFRGYLTAEFIIMDTSFSLTEEQSHVSTMSYYKGSFT